LGAAPGDNSAPPNGRYFLFQGRYKAGMGKGDTRLMDNELLRIDTATGKAWRYQGGPDKGQRIELD
jgi:hypothetical protein